MKIPPPQLKQNANQHYLSLESGLTLEGLTSTEADFLCVVVEAAATAPCPESELLDGRELVLKYTSKCFKECLNIWNMEICLYHTLSPSLYMPASDF